MPKLYYTPPSQEIFEDLRDKAIALWRTYDNSYGYADEKVNAIQGIANVGDNFMYIFAMFDHSNMRKIAQSILPETKEALRLRLEDGGNDVFFINDVLDI